MNYGFKKAMKDNTLHTSFIIEAPLSVDKLRFAKDVAKELCCHESEDGFCINCAICRQINADSYADIILIEPDIKSSKTRSIKIEQILSLQKRLKKVPYGDFNIAIINCANTISEAGFNKMLKTLEEPSRNSIIMMLSENMYKMPRTVLSRCIKVFVDDSRYDLTHDARGRKEAAELIMLMADREYFYRQKNLIESFVKDRSRGYLILDNMEKLYREMLLKDKAEYEKFTREYIILAIEHIEETRRELDENANPGYAIKKLAVAIGG